MGNKEEKNNTVPNGSTETTGRRHKSDYDVEVKIRHGLGVANQAYSH